MDTDTMIDIVLSYTDGISPIDPDAQERRDRVQQWIQEAFDMVWNYREWPWTYKTSAVTVATTGIGDLPVDFNDIGEQGGVYNDAFNYEIDEVRIQEIIALRRRGITDDKSYSIFGFNTSTNRKQIQMAVTSTQTLFVVYRYMPQDVGSALEDLPAQYHNTVILPFVIAKTRKSKGDMRDWMDTYHRGLGQMCARERHRKTAVQKLPRAISGQW